MQLPFFGKKKEVAKVFFGLFLKENEGIGLVMRLEGSKISLLDEQKFVYTNGWETIAQDIDELILKLEQRTHTHIKDTIFFVYSHFVDEKSKEIKKPYFDKIKDLVKKLDLKALGYIECYEAVVSYLEEKEEVPITALLIELDRSNLTLLVYKRGKLTYSQVMAHTDNLIDDLLTSFNEIKGKFLLPSRIILYNSKDLDEESTQIVTYRWSEELFIQLPRVEIIKEHEVIQGLMTVFSEQFGKEKNNNVEMVQDAVPEEVLGFVIGEDIASQSSQVVNKEEAMSETMPSRTVPSAKPAIGPPLAFFAGMKNVKNILNMGWQLVTKKAIIGIGIALIIVALLLSEYFLHKATLTLFLPSKEVKKDLIIESPSKLQIVTRNKTADLSDSKSTTGKKDIGEKAKGTVTLHNFDDKEKSFSKGTILTAGGVKFSLDQDYQVASSSVVTVSGGLVKQPGKTKASLTAQDIGPSGNISSGKQFTIDTYPVSLYFAINESALAGGTKKEVRTVAKKDMEDLKKSLLAKAKSAKLDQVADGKNSDLKSLSQLSEVTLANEKYSKELGEEASSLSLSAKADATVYLYRPTELTSQIRDLLTKDAPSDFELGKKDVTYTIDSAKKDGRDVSLSISSSAKFIKKVDTTEIIQTVKGKNANEVTKIVKDKFSADGLQLDVEPKVFLIQNFLPFFSKNISIKISSL